MSERDMQQAIEDDNQREIDDRREHLAAMLDDARYALRHARRQIECLTSDRVYDVEIVEGDGTHATQTIDQMLVTLAGVRAVTVEAGR